MSEYKRYSTPLPENLSFDYYYMRNNDIFVIMAQLYLRSYEAICVWNR